MPTNIMYLTKHSVLFGERYFYGKGEMFFSIAPLESLHRSSLDIHVASLTMQAIIAAVVTDPQARARKQNSIYYNEIEVYGRTIEESSYNMPALLCNGRMQRCIRYIMLAECQYVPGVPADQSIFIYYTELRGSK